MPVVRTGYNYKHNDNEGVTKMLFKDRDDAGIKLANALAKYQGKDVVVFALPRGGIVLGAHIARKLKAPLDLVITKKVGHPKNPEYALCAVAEEGEPTCSASELRGIDPVWFKAEVERVRDEIKRRRKAYFGEVKQQGIVGKIAIIVDDGIATGSTMIAAIQELRKRNPAAIVVAIPVIPHDTAKMLKSLADDLVSLDIDKHYLGSVGAYYMDFGQLEDDEVVRLLRSTSE